MMRKDIPLPTQDCCCHRIEIIADSEDDARVSAVVSELSSSRLFQTKLFNLEIYDFLLESKDTARTACGREYTVYEYRKLGGANSKEKPPDSFLKMVGAMNHFCAVFPPNPDIIMPDPADPSGEKRCRTAEEKEAYKGLVKSFESVRSTLLIPTATTFPSISTSSLSCLVSPVVVLTPRPRASQPRSLA